MTMTGARLLTFDQPHGDLSGLRERLPELGYLCHDCGRREQIETAVRARACDILLVGVEAPDGMALVRRLKTHAATRHLPAVVVTSVHPGEVAAHALAIGADDVLVLPAEDAEVVARLQVLDRVAAMADELRRRQATQLRFGVETAADPGNARQRLDILLIGQPCHEQVQVLAALGGSVSVAYAENARIALERLRRQPLDAAVITSAEVLADLPRLGRDLRADPNLFDLPLLLVVRPELCPERHEAEAWGVSDVIHHPIHPEILRLRVQSWVTHQRLKRRLRASPAYAGPQPTTDSLTGLYSHGFAHEYLSSLLDEQRGAATALAVAVLDVAGMSMINHVHGYAAGDRVLSVIGRVIERSIRAQDIAARLDSDRFVMVFNRTDEDAAAGAARRVAHAVSSHGVALGGGRLHPELSGGVASAQPDDSAARLIYRAWHQRTLLGALAPA